MLSSITHKVKRIKTQLWPIIHHHLAPCVPVYFVSLSSRTRNTEFPCAHRNYSLNIPTPPSPPSARVPNTKQHHPGKTAPETPQSPPMHLSTQHGQRDRHNREKQQPQPKANLASRHPTLTLKRERAFPGSPPLPQADMALMYVTSSGSTPACRIDCTVRWVHWVAHVVCCVI